MSEDDEPFWQCQKCKSTNVYQEGAQLIALNANTEEDEEDYGDLQFREFYWCGDCDDECQVEEIPKAPVLTLEMQLPINKRTTKLHHT